jgi:hypothetical protein
MGLLSRHLAKNSQPSKAAQSPGANTLDPQKKPPPATARATEAIPTPRRRSQEQMPHREAKAGVCCDATGGHLALTRPAGRAVSGQRVHPSAPVQTGKTGTSWSARSLAGSQALMPLAGRTATAVCFPVVPPSVVPTCRPGQRVMMAHRAAHKVKGGKAARASATAPLASCPASSPAVSPIAEGWSQFTACLRATAARTRAR